MVALRSVLRVPRPLIPESELTDERTPLDRGASEIKTTLAKHGGMLRGHSSLLKELANTLKLVVTKLDAR